MKQQKLSYQFHDPNPPKAAVGNLLRVFIEAKTEKFQPHTTQTKDKGRTA